MFPLKWSDFLFKATRLTRRLMMIAGIAVECRWPRYLIQSSSRLPGKRSVSHAWRCRAVSRSKFREKLECGRWYVCFLGEWWRGRMKGKQKRLGLICSKSAILLHHTHHLDDRLDGILHPLHRHPPHYHFHHHHHHYHHTSYRQIQSCFLHIYFIIN